MTSKVPHWKLVLLHSTEQAVKHYRQKRQNFLNQNLTFVRILNIEFGAWIPYNEIVRRKNHFIDMKRDLQGRLPIKLELLNEQLMKK